jgi:hypothetical protein
VKLKNHFRANRLDVINVCIVDIQTNLIAIENRKSKNSYRGFYINISVIYNKVIENENLENLSKILNEISELTNPEWSENIESGPKFLIYKSTREAGDAGKRDERER